MARLLIGNIRGPQGVAGPQGLQGPQGVAGPQGPLPPLINSATATAAGEAALDAAMGRTLDNKISNKLDIDKIANNVTTTAAGYVLDARQGKILSDSIATKANASDLAEIQTTVIMGSGKTVQFNDLKNGHYLLDVANSTVLNGPPNGGTAEYLSCFMLAFSNGNNLICQIACASNGAWMKCRTCWYGSWTGWKTIAVS